MLGFHFILFLFYILASFLYIDELYSVLDSFGINESYVLYIIVAIFAVGFILISISITDVTEKQVTSGITGIYFIIFSSVWLIIKYVFKPQLESTVEKSSDE